MSPTTGFMGEAGFLADESDEPFKPAPREPRLARLLATLTGIRVVCTMISWMIAKALPLEVRWNFWAKRKDEN